MKLWFLWMFVVWNFAVCLRADPFILILGLQRQTATRYVTNAPTLDRHALKAREVLNAAVDEPLKVSFHIEQAGRQTAQHGLLHLYVAPEEKLNQAATPDLKSDRLILESAVSTDFKTDRSAQGDFSFRISRPGHYLVRVECLDLEPPGKEEPFAAFDLDVKGGGFK